MRSDDAPLGAVLFDHPVFSRIARTDNVGIYEPLAAAHMIVGTVGVRSD